MLGADAATSTTTDSDHDQPIFPNRTKDMIVDRPGTNSGCADHDLCRRRGRLRLRRGHHGRLVAPDHWLRDEPEDRCAADAGRPRRGDRAAPARRPAACTTATAGRNMPPQKYRDAPSPRRQLLGSMGRRGNPYDNAMMESLMKTLKVEGIYPLEFETFEDVAVQLPASSRNTTPSAYTRRLATSARNSTRRAAHPAPVKTGCA
jgi:putative transposase